ncbi:D-glycerate dehydrogenase [Macrococcus hajekii]|uniref:D-lactate dehydrogenase n=1 Tax=Macrococcus hajekii TaxID=198482 RepID=A0A4R6BNY3_9STAP|nr:D-glycerate dehydrogenase [Macrococcus hajekii]TDM03488.1 D-glycerate dehydrogenase [Macrococcus hajekii]GGA99269.1 D-glycerate dehydrogenase [Macrococcus hajekii]
MKVLVTRKIPNHFIEQLKEVAEVKMHDDTLKPMQRKALIEESRSADVVITMMSDKIDQDYMDQCENLKAIINLAVGFDNIDVKYADEKGIYVCNTPDVLTETTAELGFTLMLVTARRIIEAAELVQQGEWQGWEPYMMAGKDVYRKSVGIYGMGSIGTALAKRCHAFDMDIMYHTRSRHEDAERDYNAKHVTFEEILQANYVVCTAPLTSETEDMFDEKAFKQMKNDAIFINIGRGGHVVEQDLLEAIQTGEIAAAGLDVLRKEPIEAGHPFLNEKQIVILPHIGSATVETRDAMIQLCVDNAKKVLNGEKPLTSVKA